MSFLSLPGELRNMIYKHLLVRNQCICVRDDWDYEVEEWLPFRLESRRPRLNLEILSTNKKIYREASWILYSQNTFRLSAWNPIPAIEFMKQIGPDNASHIQSIQLGLFINKSHSQTICIEHNSRHLIAKIRSNFHGLTRIRLPSPNTWFMAMYLEIEELDRAKAFSILNDRLREMPSLQKIVLEVDDRQPCCSGMREEMENLGWDVVHSRIGA